MKNFAMIAIAATLAVAGCKAQASTIDVEAGHTMNFGQFLDDTQTSGTVSKMFPGNVLDCAFDVAVTQATLQKLAGFESDPFNKMKIKWSATNEPASITMSSDLGFTFGSSYTCKQNGVFVTLTAEANGYTNELCPIYYKQCEMER